MKVFMLVDHAVAVSGPHRNVVGTLNALGARSDVNVTLFTEKIDDTEPYCLAKNIFIVLGFRPKKGMFVFVHLWKIFRFAAKADVVYVPSGLRSCLYAALVCLILRKPLLTGPNVTHLPFRRQDSAGNFEVQFLTDLWLEASIRRRDFVREHVKDSLREKVLNLHHAIDLNKFSPQKKNFSLWQKLSLPPDSIIVLYVGRDNIPLKGLSQLLDAIEILSGEEIFSRLQFVFAGRMSEKTKNRARKFSNVHLLGFVQGEQLCQVYASSDMSIVPSSWENFPFVVLEAMASGLPVIASRTGGIPELIQDGKNGILLNVVGPDGLHLPDTGHQIAQAILRLAKNPVERHALGNHARKITEQNFSEKKLGENLVRLFRQTLKKFNNVN